MIKGIIIDRNIVFKSSGSCIVTTYSMCQKKTFQPHHIIMLNESVHIRT